MSKNSFTYLLICVIEWVHPHGLYGLPSHGWKSTLREPEAECPGALAVDIDGHIFEALGGNDYDGTKCWVAVVNI